MTGDMVMDLIQRFYNRVVMLVVMVFAALPAGAQDLEPDGGTWRGPDGAPPMIMVALVGAACVAACAAILYSLTIGRTHRHEDRPA